MISFGVAMGWTKWRLLADKKYWHDEELDYDGPSCYELGIKAKYGRIIQPKYVGETGNEMERMNEYARRGSHLRDIIDYHLRRGYRLYYRAQAKSSKEEAIRMQNNLLARFDYDWNIQLNP